jgi:hypothetical protein
MSIDIRIILIRGMKQRAVTNIDGIRAQSGWAGAQQ